MLGDARWDARGWLEMTGVATGKQGAIANTSALMEVPFSFHGGYVFFSGSTGALTNFHSFDDLEILHQCD